MKIILVRHGESKDDVLNAYGGYADYSLTKNGLETAKQLAARFKEEKITKIISSPLKRACQTANVINKVANCGIDIAPRLFERNSYGVLTGQNKDKCKEVYGWLLEQYTEKIGNYYEKKPFFGAEPIKEFDARVASEMERLVKKYSKCKTILIVTHSNVTKSIYKNILKVKNKIDLALLAVTEIEFENGKYKLLSRENVDFI